MSAESSPHAAGAPPVTFLWDFFGPNAPGTATHFEKHLREFLHKHALSGCETGVESAGEGHMAAFCTVGGAGIDMIEKSLRPRRRRDA